MFSMIIITAWEIVAEIKGVLNMPDWLNNLYEKVLDFWGKIFSLI